MSQLTIAALAEQFRNRTLDPIAAVEQCLKRIDALEPTVRAWVVVDRDGARRAAAAASAELARGIDRGPLHGVPLGIKDIIDVAGLPTLAGARVRDGRPALRDAEIVARLRAAGAVVLGKTVTTEFASFDPSPTHNPWNSTSTPGGSSSGSAAAVAAEMCLASLGSQTGGSIIRPASYCGVCGLKPSWGRVSLTGIVPLAYHLDHPGPLARCVADLEIVYRAIAGYDPSDAVSQFRDPREFDDPADVAAGQSTPPKLGWVKGFFYDRAEADVQAATTDAVERMRAAGAKVEIIELPASFAGVVAAHRMIMAVDAAAYHRETFAARRNEYGSRIASLLDEGLAATSTDFSRALNLQLQFRRDMQCLLENSGVDGLVMPAVSNAAPPIATTGDPSFQAPWSFAGLPVVSMPSGVGTNGCPTALQVVGPMWKELPLLATAAWCERAIGFDAKPSIAG